jgi:aspartyl-tRNA(Asn)/glutamyl-tRNA(Gln) amidotransferase subunit A
MGSIEKIHEMLVSKECSCTELTKSYLDEIEKADGELNAYVNVTGEEALKTAEAVDRKIASGEEIGMLEGVPMTLKDNISTKGIETTCCSKILTGYKPIYNATVWETLAGENAVMLGKTNMDEFAMGSSCETSYFGGAMNPFDSNYVSGGSSGGVASAVGANIAAYGLGSDTGGSIRQPASFCGIVGLKPTYGAVSRYGLIAYASSLDQIGPITKSVEDAAIVFDAISKRDEKDSTSKGFVGDTYSKLNNDIKGMKIGIAKEYLEGVRDDVKEAVLKAADIYKSMGAEIVYFDLPELKFALPVYYIIACAEASSNLGRYDGIRFGYKTDHYNGTHDMVCRTRSEGFGEEVKRRILLGTYVLSAGYYDAYYKKAQNLRGLISPFMGEKLRGENDYKFIAVEPASCPSLTRGKFAYDFCDTGMICPLAKMYTLGSGFIPSANHAGGLRFHGMSSTLSQLYHDGLMEARAVEQTSVFAAAEQFARVEGILPAPESSHAIRVAIDEALKCKETGEEKTILFGLTGTGYFDMVAYQKYNDGEMSDYIPTDADLQQGFDGLPKVDRFVKTVSFF